MPPPGRLHQVHHAAGLMHHMRLGGKVSLFNYNPSIAGGALGRRFSKSPLSSHRRRRMGTSVRASWGDRQLAAAVGAQGQGLGKGVSSQATAARGAKESRKRLLEEMGAHFNKRARR